ncbi:hypothetical protein [Pedobacter sp. L105]|uniref:hypothetical protein n=1 Tax=Pedobacter sp. L105 TaxID=1641871 RepID=UPI00131D1D07|nr:hypothetical protein [Pedobacter sp. L105]
MKNLDTLAKVIAKTNPEAYKAAEILCAPMLKDIKFIPMIYSAIRDTFPEMDKTDESILLAACVYSAYAPATLIAQGIQRAPNGIRAAMCELMQWKDEPTVNYYQDKGRAYVKNPKFRERMALVMEGFEQFSLKPSQIKIT